MLYNALMKKKKDLKDFWKRNKDEEKNKLVEKMRNQDTITQGIY